MAYPQKVRETARRYWLLGYSDEKVLPLLTKDFGSEPTPTRAKTIADWRQRENWEADLEIIAAKASQKRTEEIASEVAKMSERQLGLLSQLDAHIQLLFKRFVKAEQTGLPVDTQLSASELAQLSSAIDRSIKNQRLIRNLPTTSSKIELDWRNELETIGINPDEAVAQAVELLRNIRAGETSVDE